MRRRPKRIRSDNDGRSITFSDRLADAAELAAKVNSGAADLTDVAQFLEKHPANKLAWTARKHLLRETSL